MARAKSTAKDSTADPNEKIVMVHTETGGRQVVTRRQLDNVWSSRGWTEETDADPEEVAAENAAIASTVGDTDETPEA